MRQPFCCGLPALPELISSRWPGETWMAEVERHAIVRLDLQRDEQILALGSIHTARYMGGALVDIGGLSARLVTVLSVAVGAALTVEVVREPIPEPGQIKPARVQASAGPVSHPPQVGSYSAMSGSLVDEVETLLDEAISGLWPFPGGLLCAERTRLGLIIDVDGSGPALPLNLAAVTEVARRLRLYNVGGMVIVDFIGLNNRAERSQVDAQLAAALARDPRPFEATATNGYGICQIIRPRPRASVLDTLCGTRRQAASDATAALQLLRGVVRAQGAGPRTIRTRPAHAALLQNWPTAVAEAARWCGAPVEIVAHTNPDDPDHIHVRPR